MRRKTTALVGSAALALTGTMLCGAAPAHAQPPTVTANVQGGHITDVQVNMLDVLQAAGYNVTQGVAFRVAERIRLSGETEFGIGRGAFDQNNPTIDVRPFFQLGNVINGDVGDVRVHAAVLTADGSFDRATFTGNLTCQLDANANGTCTSST